ncbi:MAG: hypothetical protein ACR2FS_11425 [Phormidesmis sp.]
MSSHTDPRQNDRQKALSLIERIPQEKLPTAVQLLELPEQGAVEEEGKLADIIQRQLPEAEQIRLNDLRDRSEWDKLSETEHQELIRYEDLLEQYRADRLAALMALAKLRNIDLISLNRQLRAPSQPSNAA